MEETSDDLTKLKRSIEASIATEQQVLLDHLPTVVRIAAACSDSLRKGGKLFTCGNGGYAAAQRLAAEVLVRLRPHVKRAALPAIALAMDT